MEARWGYFRLYRAYKKNVNQDCLNNISGYNNVKRMGHISFEAPSRVQKQFSMILKPKYEQNNMRYQNERFKIFDNIIS